jgi:hypothetical protein
MKFTFKPFQLEDLARSLMRDGSILSWEQGLGKSLAAFAWPLVKGARRTLLVAPTSLHKQLQAEGVDKFMSWLTPIEPKTFDRWKLHLPPSQKGPQKFFLTSFEQLGYNGGDEWPMEQDKVSGFYKMGKRELDRFKNAEDVQMMKFACKKLGIPYTRQNCKDHFFDGVGLSRSEADIKCVWRPTMATRIQCAEGMGGGFDCVVVDEGTALQATDSHISNGVRKLNPKYRLVLTGTPIKNRLESFFWLAQWAAGGSKEANARWPYPATDKAREEFADQHLELERYYTREEEKKENNPKWRGKVEKLTPRISNVHKFWKLAAPIMLRRRKDQCGENIVPKIISPVILQPSYDQQRVYSYFVDNPPCFRKDGNRLNGVRTAIGMQLGYLRMAALCPHSQTLANANCGGGGMQHSPSEWNPKLMACLKLILDLLQSDEQVIIGSPFTEFSSSLYTRLHQAGVAAELLDGSMSPLKRGELAAKFKKGKVRVMVAGLKAMGQGHSFECASNLILPSLSWAYDENEQFIHRIWRLNSKKPVHIYPMQIAGTIDDRLATLFAEKGDSASLALDGKLRTEQVDDIDLERLLAEVLSGYKTTDTTVSEQDMEDAWPALKRKLAKALQ